MTIIFSQFLHNLPGYSAIWRFAVLFCVQLLITSDIGVYIVYHLLVGVYVDVKYTLHTVLRERKRRGGGGGEIK